MIICKCDGCGKEVPAASNGKEFFKPAGWMERKNIAQYNGEPIYLHACSKACIVLIEEKLLEFRNTKKPAE